MIGLLQRVDSASVSVDNQIIARIKRGLLVFIGVEKQDTEHQADRLLQKITGYRIFNDQRGKMNLSLHDINGELLLVPQFTLPADTKKGMRPSFSKAAPPDQGQQLFDYMVGQAGQLSSYVAAGIFGADMKVSLVNDGPVTFWLRT